MLGRHRLVWKLSAAVTIIVAVTIAGTAVTWNVLARHFALESARSTLHFNSTSLRSGIARLMMARDNSGVRRFLEDISENGEVYRNISLVSHPSGEVVVSRLDPLRRQLGDNDISCAMCHAGGEPSGVTAEPLDTVLESEEGSRVLRVLTPILNETGCRTADCHAHADSGQMLGFIETEYALTRTDELLEDQALFTALAAAISILVATTVLFVMFRSLLGRPLRGMVRGLGALAAGDLSFRFPGTRVDEIGLAEGSFNRMASSIQAHQAELKDAAEYLEGIVENSADLIITVNPEGLIMTFNRGAEQALGYDRSEVVGRRIETLFADPSERDVAIAGLKDSDHVRNYEARFLTRNGETRHVLLTLSRLRDRDGNPIGTFGISKDISKEKELLRRLLQSEKDAAIGRAVIAIQHAVKNMLNVLRGGLYVIQVGRKKANTERIDEGCEMIEEGLSLINELSQNMLKFAREWKIELEPTDLAALLERVVAKVRDDAARRGVAVLSEIDPALPSVECDPKLIHMALMDMVSNAVDACERKDYSPGEEAKVVLRAFQAPQGGDAVVEIRDNGIGMTEEVRCNVFTPFFSTKGRTGTGLGLALSLRIIKLHNGRIYVESEPGEGAIFRITLPLGGPGTNQGESDGQESDGR